MDYRGGTGIVTGMQDPQKPLPPVLQPPVAQHSGRGLADVSFKIVKINA
jgi:hypothetical protein